MLRKSSSLILLWWFLPSCLECRLRRFRLFFPRKDLFEAGTSHAEDTKRTTQLCCRWLSNSRSHSPCTQTISIDGNHLLFSFTKLIYFLLQQLPRWTFWNVFLNLKFRGHPGWNQGPLGLQPNALPLSYHLEYRKLTKHCVFTRVHKTGEKAFVLGVTMIFLAFSLRKPTQGASNFFFPTENCFDAGILRTGDKCCTTPLYSRSFSCSTRQSLYSEKFTWLEPTPSFGHHVNSWFFSIRCPGGHFRTIPLVQKLGHPGWQHVPLSLHTNSLPMCQVSLWFITRQSTLFLLLYTSMVRKCSSLMLLRCFSFSCSECRLRRFRLLFPRKDLFEAVTSDAEVKKRTTQLCCRWLSNSRAHSPCTQTISIDGNHLLFSFTKLIYFLLQQLPRWTFWNVFLNLKFRGHPGWNQGPLGLQPNALPLSYILWISEIDKALCLYAYTLNW